MATNSYSQKTIFDSLRFQKGDLTSISQAINSHKSEFSGYLQFILDNPPKEENSRANIWYIFFSRGKIVFSSSQEMNFLNILEVLKNYLPALRNPEAKSQAKIDKLILLAKEGNNISPLKLLIKLTLETKLVEYQQVIKVIQTHILNDFEQYLFSSSGRINVIIDKAVDIQKPVVGFDLQEILLVIKDRRIQWPKLQEIIPSLDVKVRCNEQNSQWKSLPIIQKQKIEQLVNSGDSLKQIRYNLGEDNFKITQIFAKLWQKKLVIFGSDNNSASSVSTSSTSTTDHSEDSSPAEIAIIDDSLILLKQFQKMVTNWGYSVRYCDDALAAVDFLLKAPPKIIFLDVNMPHLSGFELIKKIRIQTKLNSIPLVVLTAENTLMNNHRAKWSKSIFLTKPLHKDDINTFKLNLKNLLEKMLPPPSPK